MSYSRRQLYALGEPLGESVTRLKPGGRVYGGGGSGGGGDTSTQTQTTDLPDWAKPYAKDILSKGAALSDTEKNPYQTFAGQRIAGFQPLQEQAFKTVGGMDAGPQGFQQNIGSYMSPYMQNVVDIEKREAGRQSGIMGTQQQAQATQAGAFGGARDALQRAERERNLAQQMGDIQTRGSQAAYESAANQFRQGITQQSGLAQLQGNLGAQQQQQAQRPLDVAYQDFLNQQNYPYKQLGFMSDLLRGTPTGSSSTINMYQPPGSALGQIAGLGTGIYGLSQMGLKFADGGEVDSYAEGGVTSQGNVENILAKLSDQQLSVAREAAMNRRDVGQLQMIDAELAERASLRNGLGNAFNQIPVQQQEEMMAGGGIVAFADEGAVDLEKIQREKDRAALGQAYEDFKTGARKTGAAAMDIGTMPFRGIAGAAESVITRPLRALGLDIPYLPESYYGGDASSMTPYMDKLRKEEGVEPTSKTANRPQPKGAGARSTPVQIAPDVASAPKKKEKTQRISPTVDKAITQMAEQQGVPKDDFMDMFDRFRDKLQAESKEDLKGLQDLIDKQSGKSKEIKQQALGKALAEFGFNMAAQASKPGARFLGSAAAASPTIAASAAESQKLAAAADENDIKMQIEMRKFNIASRKNDSATAMSAAQNMRQLQQSQAMIQQQQAQLAETRRSNMAKERLLGQRIAATGGGSGLKGMQFVARSRAEAIKLAQKEVDSKIKGSMTMVKPADYDRMLNKAMKKYLPITTGFGMTGIASSEDNDGDIIDLD
jgi:hypothetical protein